MNKKKLFVLLPACLLALAGCTPSESNTSSSNEDIPSSNEHSNPSSEITSSKEDEASSSEENKSVSVTITNGNNGTVTANKLEAKVGEEIILTISVEDGYHVASLLVNGINKTDDIDSNNQLKEIMPEEGLTVKLTTAEDLYAATIDPNIVGGELMTDEDEYSIGSEVYIWAFPDDGYELLSITVNGEEVDFDVDQNAAITEMVKGGLFISATFSIETNPIIIDDEIENGTVTADKEDAAVGENVTLTITPNEGYRLKQLTINGEVIEVENNTYIATMGEYGLFVSAAFTNATIVSEFTEELISSIKESDNISLELSNDVTLSSIPLAKENTSIDLGGHKIIITEGNALIASSSSQKITLTNGEILTTSSPKERTNIIDVSLANSFTMDEIALSNQEEYPSTSSAIYCSNAVNVDISNSSILFEGTYGIGTNNLEGKDSTISIDNSTIIVTSTDKDNAAMLGNTEGLNVSITDSSFEADRQAIIARMGEWDIEGSDLTITGEWLKKEGNTLTNSSYLSGSWRNGNEVPSSSLVAGDRTSNAYNGNVNITLVEDTFTSNGGNTVVAGSDGTYVTTLTLDAPSYITYLANEQHDETSVINLPTDIKNLSISEIKELEEDDAENIYFVTGIIKEITNPKFGNAILIDKATGEELTIYGGYSYGSYFYDMYDGYTLNTDDATPIKEDYIGKEVTLAGTFLNYNGTKELKNAVVSVVKGEVRGLNADVVNLTPEFGSVSLSKTSDITYGEIITVDATPNDGYKIGSVIYTDINGKETNITNDMAFFAGLVNHVKVTFVPVGEKVEKSTTISVDDFESCTGTSFSKTFDDLKVSVTNGAINGQIRVYKDQTITIEGVSSDILITKIDFIGSAGGSSQYGLGGFEEQDGYSFESKAKTATYVNSNGTNSVSFKASKQVRIVKMVITYIA